MTTFLSQKEINTLLDIDDSPNVIIEDAIKILMEAEMSGTYKTLTLHLPMDFADKVLKALNIGLDCIRSNNAQT